MPAKPALPLLLGLASALVLGSPASAARLTIWDLPLGAKVAEMPDPMEFKGYACGSNGGPPLQKLEGWADFAKCAPDAAGLHEVYFEYDDEDEYIARAHEDQRLARDIGTVDKSFPIVASALFDDQGVLRGIRLVTDPRVEARPDNEWAGLRPREDFYLLASYLGGQFGIDPKIDCKKQPLAPGESPVGGVAVKMECERVDPASSRRYVLDENYFRKPGQTARDPVTGNLTQGQFESQTRAEVYVANPGKTG